MFRYLVWASPQTKILVVPTYMSLISLQSPPALRRQSDLPGRVRLRLRGPVHSRARVEGAGGAGALQGGGGRVQSHEVRLAI